eukprot:SAG25_NODE_5365_length_667_cov_0.980634_1_plen_51_part_10
MAAVDLVTGCDPLCIIACKNGCRQHICYWHITSGPYTSSSANDSSADASVL